MQAVHAQFLRYVTVWGDIHPHCHIPLYSISVGYKSFFIKGIYLLYKYYLNTYTNNIQYISHVE